MPFLCPSCNKPSLEIVRSIELPPDDEWDEITVQTLVCSGAACGFSGIGIYEESRRGALDSECVRHTGYATLSGDAAKVAALIRRKDKVGLARSIQKTFPLEYCA